MSVKEKGHQPLCFQRQAWVRREDVRVVMLSQHSVGQLLTTTQPIWCNLTGVCYHRYNIVPWRYLLDNIGTHIMRPSQKCLHGVYTVQTAKLWRSYKRPEVYQGFHALPKTPTAPKEGYQ